MIYTILLSTEGDERTPPHAEGAIVLFHICAPVTAFNAKSIPVSSDPAYTTPFETAGDEYVIGMAPVV
jgi:hypothetical protein